MQQNICVRLMREELLQQLLQAVLLHRIVHKVDGVRCMVLQVLRHAQG